MNPFYFGRAPKALFGVYHPPKASAARETGVVLCYPFGQEYMRAHRAFRQIAMLLSKGGFHVLRFDYSGTGDSSGEDTEALLSEWVHDTSEAVQELKDISEVSTVSFVGLRLGACVAALAAASRTDVGEVVLWDPVVLGRDYLAELLVDRTDSAGHSRRSQLEGGTLGISGFPITTALRSELEKLNLLEVAPPAATSGRFVVTSHERPEFTELQNHTLEGVRSRCELASTGGDWNEVDDYGGVLIPVRVIQAIVAHLNRESR